MGSAATPYTTSGSANTEIDVFSVKAGAAAACNIYSLRGAGRANNLTSLYGIELNWKLWTTASTAGSTLTPSANDTRHAVAAGAVPRIGTGGGTNAVTPGTGGGAYRNGIAFGASGPGGWVAANPDAALQLAGGYAGSFDLYSMSPGTSLPYTFVMEHSE